MSRLGEINQQIKALQEEKKNIKNWKLSRKWYENLFYDVVGDDNAVPPDDLAESVDVVLSELGERQKQIILMRYKEKMTLEKCANHLGVCRERVRGIQAKTLRLLRYAPIGRILIKGKAEAEKIEKERIEALNSGFSKLGELPIERFGLSVRAYNCLKRANINTAKDLKNFIDCDASNLLRIRNLGICTATEICRKFNIKI